MGMKKHIINLYIRGRNEKKVNTKYLRMAIAVVIAITGLKMWHQILGW